MKTKRQNPAQRRIAQLEQQCALLTAIIESKGGCMSEWQPIETAPKGIAWRTSDGHEYGNYILAYPYFGEVVRVRWWQCPEPDGTIRSCNFLTDGGNSCYPNFWMPLPEPPKRAA